MAGTRANILGLGSRPSFLHIIISSMLLSK